MKTTILAISLLLFQIGCTTKRYVHPQVAEPEHLVKTEPTHPSSPIPHPQRVEIKEYDANNRVITTETVDLLPPDSASMNYRVYQRTRQLPNTNYQRNSASRPSWRTNTRAYRD